jgi:hypothetical protein
MPQYSHRITVEICDLPGDDRVGCALARLQQDRRRLLTPAEQSPDARRVATTKVTLATLQTEKL